MQNLAEQLQQRPLTSKDAFLCLRDGEPAAPIDFRDLNPVLGPWRPFDLT
jgi:hypothetical protein